MKPAAGTTSRLNQRTPDTSATRSSTSSTATAATAAKRTSQPNRFHAARIGTASTNSAR